MRGTTLKQHWRVRLLLPLFVLLASAAAPARADDVAEAREHFRKGSKAFDLAHYREAVKEYEAAYQIKDDPALLFNIAQAYRLDGDNEDALRVYKSYLNRVPDAPNRADVERHMDEARLAIERNRQAAPPTAPPPTVATPTTTTPVAPAAPLVEQHPRLDRRTKAVGIGLTAGGVALLALGGAFVGLANQANGEVITSSHYYSQSAADRRDHYELADAVCFGVGGAVAVTGAVLWALSAHAESRSKLSAALLPNGALGVRF